MNNTKGWGSFKKFIQWLNEVKMTCQKLRVGIKCKQNECFVSKEIFSIVRSQTSKGLILGLRNKD